MRITASRLTAGLFIILVSVFLVVRPAFGQEDSALSLTIRLAKPTSQFRVGEIISVELAFLAFDANTYTMSTRSYDRSGRLGLEQFHVNPPGRDPLHSYYEGGLYGGFSGGGLGSFLYLSSEPQIMREDLNEWVALDKPGHYMLYVTSHRVTRRGESGQVPVELRSNTLEFEVIPADPAWRDRSMTEAVSVLNSADSTEEEKQTAIHVIRFLDSPESVRELVRQLAKPGEAGRWNFVAGLIGSRHQELVLRELEVQLSHADAAITAEYLMLFAQTKFLPSHAPLPPYPDRDKVRQETWLHQQKTRIEEFNGLVDTLYQQTTALVSTKRGAARAETVRTLLLRPVRESSDVKPLAGLPPSEVASAFLVLSPQKQVDMLRSFWAVLKVPEMAGSLEKILDEPQIPNQLLRDLALQRLHELDPSAAAGRILAEIRQPHLDEGMFSVSGKTLSVLPNKTLPEFDQLLAARLEDKESRTRGLDAQLIGRYATKAILPRVKAVYETAAGEWDCNIQDGLISYFLRVDPDYGVKRMGAVNSFCLAQSLKAVVQMKRWSEVEPEIIRKLDDPNLRAARQAVETLARYGGPDAEKAMWERLRRFHQQWKEREKQLQNSPNSPPETSETIGFQFGLVEALGKAQGWLLDNDQIAELENLTLGQERENVARWHWHSPVELTIHILSDGRFQAHVNGQYFMDDVESLRAKLAQFPAGTRFWMNSSGPQEQLQPVIQAIDETLQAHGLTVETAPAK